ncbi:hypothetical protein VZT92_011350 [Zoarces viviparus]|uniref:Uncharacterized protein n=1 Tax=Zoarces viviparus TaxID=48416 RepID=A0AAW1FBD5_ZOAVI
MHPDLQRSSDNLEQLSFPAPLGKPLMVGPLYPVSRLLQPKPLASQIKHFNPDSWPQVPKLHLNPLVRDLQPPSPDPEAIAAPRPPWGSSLPL